MYTCTCTCITGDPIHVQRNKETANNIRRPLKPVSVRRF